MRSGELLRAADATIRVHGADVYGLLCALHPEAQADDVYAAWTIQVWRGLEAFRWECSLRTWVYAIARAASATARRGQARREKHEQLASESGALARAAAEARSTTPPYLKSDAHRALMSFRETLPEDDRLLLILRLDRNLDWKDVARVLGAADISSEADLVREAQRLRKRFQLLKGRLKDALRSAGLIDQTLEA